MEEGTISLILTGNQNSLRTGELMVYALDAVNPEQKITIIQREQAGGVQSSISGDRSLRIYPNPAGQEIYVELPEGFLSGTSTISIITVDGKCVFRKNIPAGSTGTISIPLDDIAPGVYLIKAEQGQRSCMARFARN